MTLLERLRTTAGLTAERRPQAGLAKQKTHMAAHRRCRADWVAEGALPTCCPFLGEITPAFAYAELTHISYLDFDARV